LGVLYITLFIVVFDQVTKFLVKGGTIPLLNINVNGLQYGQSIPVFNDFFKITFVENPGLAFGIDVNESSKLLLSLFSLLASIGILYYIWKSKNQKLIVRIALAMVLGGAIGNLIDRMFYGVLYGYAPVFYGKVVDFFNVDFFDFTIFGKTFDRWPIFNIADASVSVGVVLLILFHKSVPEKGISKKPEDIAAASIIPGEVLTSDFSADAIISDPQEVVSSNQIETMNDVKDSNREENKD
jgi:signal peptidase II